MIRRAPLLALLLLPLAAACGADDDDDAASSSTTAAAPVECDVVGDTDAASTGDLDVTLAEWTIEYEGDGAAAGNVTFVVHNEGEVEHEIAIEDSTGTLIGEIEPFAAGSTCEGTFELSAGTYTLLCEIVDEDGMSHATHGMKAELVVS
jgi:plastocyanin